MSPSSFKPFAEATISDSLILLPTPREIALGSGTYKVSPAKRIALLGAPAQELMFVGQRLRDAIQRRTQAVWTLSATATGARAEIGAILRVDAARVPGKEAYELQITPDGIDVVAGSPRGLFYAACTLAQIIDQSSRSSAASFARLPCLHISDAPDFPNRGVMLDISRCRVPTLETLLGLVDLLASWKINQFQLYIEHTFAYRNHREVWQDASPLTEQEVLELDRFCRDRFIELVPNQNSFGHMRPWLIHDRYRDLAECPDGCDTVWGHFDEPFTLNPLDPRSLELLREMYDELLPNFSSRQFNVGCDETVDLGKGRSRGECEAKGTGRVYLRFLLEIYKLVKARGYTMMFWGDVIIQHPELIGELPRDVVALEWGYEADHPFDSEGAEFANAGIPFYVCPGTSTWNSIAGRIENARLNLLNAAAAGRKHGAVGYLNTDWGDNGHWQHLPFSFPGFGYGAAVSWCLETNRDLDLAFAISRFAFHDPTGTLGQVALDLGNVYREIGIDLQNASPLFRILQTPLAQIRTELPGLMPVAIERAQRAVDRAVRPLRRLKPHGSDARLVVSEFEHAAAMLRFACARGLLTLEDNPAKSRALRRKLAVDLRQIIRDYRRLWHARNRPGGFKESVARLEKLREELQ